MTNTSTVGIPPNCKNWLALGAVIFGDMSYRKALRIIGLKEQCRIDEMVTKERVKALIDNGLNHRQIAEELDVNKATLREYCKRHGLA